MHNKLIKTNQLSFLSPQHNGPNFGTYNTSKCEFTALTGKLETIELYFVLPELT